MQRISRVSVIRRDDGLFSVSVCWSKPGLAVSGQQVAPADDVPMAVLTLLGKFGQRFVGSMPDFGKRPDYEQAFYVISEPVAQAAAGPSPYDLSDPGHPAQRGRRPSFPRL